MKTMTTFLQTWIAACFLLFSFSAKAEVSCRNYFEQKRVESAENSYLSSPTERLIKRDLDTNSLRAAWNLSVHGVSEIGGSLHEMDVFLYYALTALLSKENILVDGDGGGSKTGALRRLFAAQERASNKMSAKELQTWAHERSDFLKELLLLIQKDKKETDLAKRVFTKQMYEGMTEASLIGAVNAFASIEKGDHSVDYRAAIIAEKNFLGILDEIEKAPVAVQMTALAVLSEREALLGNKVVKTMLECIAATTNATLSALIAQALPHEIGGRMAFIDRFAAKVNLFNSQTGAQDRLLLTRLVRNEERQALGSTAVIDISGLSGMIGKVVIPKEVLEAAIDIELAMGQAYTKDYNAAKAKAAEKKQTPQFYPPYSGSTRSAGKIPRMWPAAFLMRQMMLGVPFDSLRLTMQPQDLIDLAPTFLHGGADMIVPSLGEKMPMGERVVFLQVSQEMTIVKDIIPSPTRNATQRKGSIGYYDPHTQIFQYYAVSARKVRRLKFDLNTQQLIINDPEVRAELITDPDDVDIFNNKRYYLRAADINGNLAKLHAKLSDNKSPVKFNLTDSTGKQQLIEGTYDSHLKIFEYTVVRGNQNTVRKVSYDENTRQLRIEDAEIRRELSGSAGAGQSLADLNTRIAKLHDTNSKYAPIFTSTKIVKKPGPNPNRKNAINKTEHGVWETVRSLFPMFTRTQRGTDILSPESLASKSTKQTEEVIIGYLDKFLRAVTTSITTLTGNRTQVTPIDPEPYIRAQKHFEETTRLGEEAYREAIASGEERSVMSVSASLVRNAIEELKFYFKESGQDFKALFLALLNKGNVMISGGPGSAKTLKARLILNMVLKGFTETQIDQMSAVMAEGMYRHLPKKVIKEKAIYIKQFHPMTSEGEVIGRLDLKAMKKGDKFTLDRTGAMSAHDVIFSLLDEFEKAPASVRTSLLSLLNERAVFDGDETLKTALIAVIISTNNTKSEFVAGLKPYSQAFPLIDRVHYHANIVNKLSRDALLDYVTMNYLGVRGTFGGILSFEPLRHLADMYRVTRREDELLNDISSRFILLSKEKLDTEREAHDANPLIQTQFYVPARLNTSRTAVAIADKETRGAVVLSRALRGEVDAILESKDFDKDKVFTFQPSDLIAYAELHLTFSNQYKIEMTFDAAGKSAFVLVEDPGLALIKPRLDSRDLLELNNIKWEHDQMVLIMNTEFQKFLISQKKLIMEHPELYPSLFSSKEERIHWLSQSGMSEGEIAKYYRKEIILQNPNLYPELFPDMDARFKWLNANFSPAEIRRYYGRTE